MILGTCLWAGFLRRSWRPALVKGSTHLTSTWGSLGFCFGRLRSSETGCERVSGQPGEAISVI
ncbi:hypothetical protein K0M31_010932 [Melipona bicolor]|uniref:Uncharacterized protein n=1 Tax=Melipona bicolor TaxID=60889 RepID=A0AA40FKV5_9HYME|nr:hypothetical protein K0M31_010932 [Melipona bicolor]